MLPQALTRLRRSNSERVRAFVLLLTAALALLLVAAASQNDIPPKPTRWVTDDAAMLTQAAATAIDNRLESYERQTGHQVVVWIGTTTALPLEELATRTFQAWELGREGHDDGVLILLLATDRKIAIEVGYGLEDRVPDALASRIINDVMVPELRGGNPEAAVSNGVGAVLSAIEGKAVASKSQSATPKKEKARRTPPQLGLGKAIVIGLLALGFFILLLTNPSLAITLLAVLGSGGRGGGGFRSGGFGGGGGFSGGGGRSGGGGARGSW